MGSRSHASNVAVFSDRETETEEGGEPIPLRVAWLATMASDVASSSSPARGAGGDVASSSPATSSASTAATSCLAGKSIIVVGGGIAGLAFCLGLHRQPNFAALRASGTTVQVFERDTYDDRVGREGYAISLRSDAASGGVQALDKLGVYDEMIEASVTGRTGERGKFAIWDRDWHELLTIRVRVAQQQAGEKELKSMRIRRNEVQRILAQAVAALGGVEVHWAETCVGVDTTTGPRIQVRFDGGRVEECDVVVAADGASSRVRRALRPDDQLDFAGASAIGATACFAQEELVPRPMNRDWGGMLVGDGHGLFVSPVDGRRANWSISYRATAPRPRQRWPLSADQVHQLLDEALARGQHVPEPYATLVKATDPTTLIVLNAMDKQPFAHDAAVITAIAAGHGHTLFIGDSNHAVSPFAGNGANMALMDGWDLACCLCRHDSIQAAMAAYDALSLPRARQTLRMSHYSIDLLHAQGWKLTLYALLLRVMQFLFFR